MAIETICKGCARKLRVGDEFAGRKARCPHCKTVYTVPDGVRVDTPSTGARDGWLLRGSDGSVYGPVSKSELDDWVREGRVDATSQLQQEGEDLWQRAAEVYPALLPTASEANPFFDEPPRPTQVTNPYATPGVGGRMGQSFVPHRGSMILILGLLGLFCCQVASIIAWVMGHADMKAINAGRMDPAGRGLTQAGMIIGIIGTALMVLGIGFQLIMMLWMIVNG